MMMMSSRNKSPFTPSQWQELEHQALILKYIMSGIPVPSDLIFTLKANLFDSSTLSPHQQQPIGWGCFQMGFGRKADPEPGRCRRTDGKKWRCSKEAFADSKYCERHMHRGKNRSRKPVELPSSSSSSSPSSSSSTTYSTTHRPSLSSSLNYESNAYPFLLSHSSPTSRPPDSDFASQNNNTRHLFLDSASYSDRDYRYFNGVRNVVDERAFFPASDSLTPLAVSPSLVQSKHESFPALHTGYSAFQVQSLSSNSKQQEEYHRSQPQQQQHCFIMGSDFKSVKENREEVNQKPLHHFLGDWNTKNRETWIDFREPKTSFATTQLSISIPVSSPEFLSSNSRISNW
ncbi:WRC domain [Dillenia turbinata]|uniref:Growth-regulating factor n=1 Tax=Dillenia turbinata TaxID=194707 RepID=A0AAN8UKY6_9MAGN